LDFFPSLEVDVVARVADDHLERGRDVPRPLAIGETSLARVIVEARACCASSALAKSR
jgi:hypothetical protein